MGEELTIVRKPVPETAPTLRDLLAVMFRQRRLALISFFAIFLSVLGYGVFAPSYQAHMNVLVRRGRVDPVVTPAPTPSPMFQRDEITEEELNSQVELLRDDEILRTVVQSSSMTASPWYERFLGGSEEVRLARSVRRMTRRLTVEPIRKTNLIQVTLLGMGTHLLLPRAGIAGYGWAELLACIAYFLIHTGLSQVVAISYRRILPWLAFFLPALFILS